MYCYVFIMSVACILRLFIAIIFCTISIFSCSFNILYAGGLNLDSTMSSVVKIYTADFKNTEEINTFFKSNEIISAPEISVASGVIFDTQNGYIISNSHVINGKNFIKVVLNSGLVFKAKVVANDKELDLAILQLYGFDNIKLSSINIVTSKSVKVGDEVFAIGNPFNIGLSTTKGIVSAIRTTSDSFGLNIADLIQTDMVLNPGNSGGPLLDHNGNLIGINSSILLPKGLTTAISFAIPSDLVLLFINKSLRGEKINKYCLGISVSKFDGYLDRSSSSGLLINRVYYNSPAYLAGLKEGDVILSINNLNIDSVSGMNLFILSLGGNNPIFLRIIRESKLMSVKVVPDTITAKNNYTTILSGLFKNIKVMDNTSFNSCALGIPYYKKGVIVQVDDTLYTQKYGLKSKDVIFAINHKEIDSVDSIIRLLEDERSIKNIIFFRDNAKFEVNIRQ